MKTGPSSKRGKRKPGKVEDCSSPSKVSKVTKRTEKVTSVKSKYFEAKTKIPNEQRNKNASACRSIDTSKKEKECNGETEVKASSSVTPGDRLGFSFYDLSCEDLAKALLGQILVMKYEGKRLVGKIVETEAYLGPIDKGAHSYKGKTDRNAAMFMKPGTAYVYNIYGMYCCMNISARGK